MYTAIYEEWREIIEAGHGEVCDITWIAHIAAI
jgi:hypothetical protein